MIINLKQCKNLFGLTFNISFKSIDWQSIQSPFNVILLKYSHWIVFCYLIFFAGEICEVIMEIVVSSVTSKISPLYRIVLISVLLAFAELFNKYVSKNSDSFKCQVWNCSKYCTSFERIFTRFCLQLESDNIKEFYSEH